MHLQLLINAIKSGPKINAKGAKERKKTKEVEIILKTKKTNMPLMSDSSKPRQRKIKHLPSEPLRSWAQTQYQGAATPEMGAIRGGKMGWLCKLESHCKPSNDGVSIPSPNHEDATSLLYPQQKARFAPGERSWEDSDSRTRTSGGSWCHGVRGAVVGHGATGRWQTPNLHSDWRALQSFLCQVPRALAG